MWILRSGISETRTGNSLRVYPQWARALFKYLIVQSFWGWEWNKFEQVRFQLFCDPYSVYFRQKKSQAQFMVETLFLPWLLRGTFFWWIYTWNWSWQTWNRTCSNLFQAGLLKLLVLLDYDSILSIYMSNLSESFGVEKILTGAPIYTLPCFPRHLRKNYMHNLYYVLREWDNLWEPRVFRIFRD